nr:hypothetical protein [Tanacetum cinerariifolium]
QLRIVLSVKDRENYLEHPIPAVPVDAPGQQNYNMHNLGKTVNELHAMLKLHEQKLPKKDVTPALHAIRARRVQKNQKKTPHKAAKGNQGKRKAKMGYATMPAPSFALKPKNPPPPKKDNHAKDAICHECDEVGHWRWNCPGLRGSRKLKPGALSLYVDDGHCASVEAIGEFHFKKRIEKLQHNGLLNLTNIKSFEKCVSCMSGKMTRKPCSHQVERSKDLLGLIHTDICSPFRTVSRQGASYFVTFTDDFSRYGYVYFLKHKHEVFETFKVFQKEVENQLRKTIKSLRSDRGGEYTSQEFLDHLKEHGIIAHQTPPYTPQYNGVSERRDRTLLDMVDKTPYEVWHGQASKLSYLKVWGCKVLVKHDTLTKPNKLEPGSIKCIFVGYPKETIGYYFYYPPENKVFVARNAKFFENSLITQKASGSLEDLEIIQEEDTHPSIDISLHHDEDDQEIDEPQSDINPI